MCRIFHESGLGNSAAKSPGTAKKKTNSAAQGVLDARAQFPNSSLSSFLPQFGGGRQGDTFGCLLVSAFHHLQP